MQGQWQPPFRRFVPAPPNEFCVHLRRCTGEKLTNFPLTSIRHACGREMEICAVAFLPPNVFLCFRLRLLVGGVDDGGQDGPGHSFSKGGPCGDFSLHRRGALSPQEREFVLTEEVICLHRNGRRRDHEAKAGTLWVVVRNAVRLRVRNGGGYRPTGVWLREELCMLWL